MTNKTKPWKFDPRGAKCAACKQQMLAAYGCLICLLRRKDGARVSRANTKAGGIPAAGRCHDCGAKVGQPRSPSRLEVVRCPVCGQLALCFERLEGAKMFAPLSSL